MWRQAAEVEVEQGAKNESCTAAAAVAAAGARG